MSPYAPRPRTTGATRGVAGEACRTMKQNHWFAQILSPIEGWREPISGQKAQIVAPGTRGPLRPDACKRHYSKNIDYTRREKQPFSFVVVRPSPANGGP